MRIQRFGWLKSGIESDLENFFGRFMGNDGEAQLLKNEILYNISDTVKSKEIYWHMRNLIVIKE